MKIVVFSGLSHPIMIRPTIHGEPLLTAQAFYYLEKLESIAHIRFESGIPSLSEEQIEYLLDNYLFAYSQAHDDSRMSFKISIGKFWQVDGRDFYIPADEGYTQSLAIDKLNDSSVLSIISLNPDDDVDFSDWNIGHNYARKPLEDHINSLCDILDKKVAVGILPSEYRDGYFGKLRILKAESGLIDHFQAEALDMISLRSVSGASEFIKLESSNCKQACRSLPIERITVVKEHTPLLLSHYFSGLKERNPLKAYVGFYNVLEYYFEEAPMILGRSARTELEQLRCVLDMLISDADLQKKLCQLDGGILAQIQSDMVTSSPVQIAGLRPNPASTLCHELARWLYEIRCAIVHSKKTRRGVPTAVFEPYSESARNVGMAIPLIKWLSILCIEKDYALRTGLV